MKIVLVYPSYPGLLVQNLDPPLDLINVANSIKQCGDVSICDLRITDKLPEADIYGLTATTPTFSQAVALLKRIKLEYPDSKVIIGGHHVSALPTESLEAGFDKIFIGESEETLPQIFANWESALTIINGKTPWYLPPYKIHEWVNKQDYIRPSQNIYSLILSRGCIFKCRYCASTKYYRRMDIGDIFKTIASLGDIKGLRLMDENFLIHMRWFYDVTRYLKELSVPYFIFCRGEDLNDNVILYNLQISGCKVASIGFETGSQALHDSANTGKNVDRMMEGIKKANNHGIEVRLNLMIGLPDETWDDIEETVEKVNQLNFVSYSINHFVPYPGTYWYNGYFNFDKAYCACGEDKGYLSCPEIEERQKYLLRNLRGLPHSKVTGRGLL